MNTIRCIALWCLVYSLAPAQRQSAIPQAELDRQIDSALNTGNTTLLDSLVNANRLAIKPLVENLLVQAMKSEASGRGNDFHAMLQNAQAVSSSFQRIHGEKGLTRAVDDVRRWSKEERSVKLAADSLHALGTKLRGKGETRDQALELYRKSLGLYRTLNDQRGEATALGSLGFIFWYKNDPDQALHYFEEGLNLRTLVDDRQLVGNSYNDIGSVYYNFLKDYARAIEFHRRAETIRRAIGDRSGLGRTMDNLALDYWDAGDLKEALRCAEEAARTHAEVGDQEKLSRSLHNSGILLTDLGRYADALLVHDRSLDLRQKLGDKAGIAQAFDAKGVVYYRIGDFESAYGCYRQALSMMEEVGDERGVASASYKCGVVLSDLGRIEQAFSAYQRSLDMAEKTGDVQTALHALSNMGVTYIDMGQYPKAEEVLKSALVMSRELPDYTVEIIDLTMLGNAQNFQGKSDSASQNYRHALRKARARETPELMWPALLGLGDLEEKHHVYEASIGYYTQALECIERVRGNLSSEQFKISFADKKRYVYEAIVHLMTVLHMKDPTAGYDARAFHIAESAKARAFLDLLSESLARVSEGADSLLVAKQDSLLAAASTARERLDLLQDAKSTPDSIENIRETIDAVEREVRRVERELRLKNPRYAALKYPRPAVLDDVQKTLLDSRTALLEYSVGDSSSSLWVLTRTTRQLFKLPDRTTITNQIEVLRSLLQNPDAESPAAFAAAAYRAYQLLVQPAEHALKKGMRIIIVPDGELHALPFEILLMRKGTGSYRDFPYLIRSHPVAYVQSATVMVTLHAQHNPGADVRRKDLIAFGDPIFAAPEDSIGAEQGISPRAASSRGTLARLPYTAAEVRNIARLFPADRVDLYMQENATEERVKQPGLLKNYRFVHFATHGILNQRRPDLSAIVLSRSRQSKEDGVLRSSEVLHLALSADLVTLSACGTGLGKITRGEGLIGLTRSFMYAGTPSVVASLWSVADVSTATFMERFYQEMVVAKLDKAEALRRAKLALCASEKYAHPFYWAPFILIGEWQ